ncbi:MAG: Fe-S protein assembly co-chaperone HscB [Planctomycetota bacterium]|nr:Fe-S protein assembly co-chaperone HscB [Planctomycetota bacterium]
MSCAACKRPLSLADDVGPFDVLGLAPGYAIDAQDLRKRVLRISRDIHPDFFGAAASADRDLAERNSARVNKAFEILSDDVERADWIVRSLGGPDEQAERAMPREFLMEVLEWNETLEEARATTDTLDPRLVGLRGELANRRAAALASIASLLTPLPTRGSSKLLVVRQQLNSIRYLDRALTEIESLRLARAATR